MVGCPAGQNESYVLFLFYDVMYVLLWCNLIWLRNFIRWRHDVILSRALDLITHIWQLFSSSIITKCYITCAVFLLHLHLLIGQPITGWDLAHGRCRAFAYITHCIHESCSILINQLCEYTFTFLSFLSRATCMSRGTSHCVGDIDQIHKTLIYESCFPKFNSEQIKLFST